MRQRLLSFVFFYVLVGVVALYCTRHSGLLSCVILTAAVMIATLIYAIDRFVRRRSVFTWVLASLLACLSTLVIRLILIIVALLSADVI